MTHLSRDWTAIYKLSSKVHLMEFKFKKLIYKSPLKSRILIKLQGPKHYYIFSNWIMKVLLILLFTGENWKQRMHSMW